ncbi:MAG: FtsW/RodA/SpoVE family cell cycle protein [Crocinitomicaceae bacterium]|jgi:cell division protein FtsW|nr:FtsW/RodA/SpoVE family cell cycle protein [Crocinitomicaceae bacterium]MDG2463717.1 FtsW/RodA/SpoVE family cell cycle protein [Crocinitomicaceae bacterium]
MNKYLDYLKGDRVIWIITLLMLAFSLVSVYSFVPILVKIEGGTPFKYLFKHFVYVLIGLGLMLWVHRKDPKYFSMLSKVAFYLAVGLLLFTFFFGAKVNGAGRWVRIPFVGLTFQSSDFAKLAIIVYLSRLMVKKSKLMNDWKKGFWPIMLPIFIICGLIVKDNFSTATILFSICLVMLFLGKIPFGKIAIILGSGAIFVGCLVGLQKAVPEINVLPRLETWENRILNRMDDEKNVAANAQALNAKLGIYNGGWMGQGVGDGKLKEYIPEAYADFYYASFVEEFGIISAVFLILLYLILLFRIIKIALRSDKLFETYLCIGIGILLLSQASVNMLVCTGIFPVTGQNMPLLAMGGSALIMTCLSIGIIQSIAYRQMKTTNE